MYYSKDEALLIKQLMY